MDQPNLDAPKILKDRWLQRVTKAVETKASEALNRSPHKTYSSWEIIELIKTAHRAVREDLALEEATR